MGRRKGDVQLIHLLPSEHRRGDVGCVRKPDFERDLAFRRVPVENRSFARRKLEEGEGEGVSFIIINIITIRAAAEEGGLRKEVEQGQK